VSTGWGRRACPDLGLPDYVPEYTKEFQGLRQIGIGSGVVPKGQLPRIPDGAPILPGDLVFFGTGPSAVRHVGIAVSATDMIDAPHAGALTLLEPITADLVGVTRPG
jgi:cell wall-associated NlpC family hydrolase